MSKPLLTFRIYPEGSYLYAEVNVWPTKKAMYGYKPLNRNHEASCTGTTLYRVSKKQRGRPQRTRKTGLFAELNFYRGYLGVGCVSHEMTHAAFSWADRVKLPLSEISESPLSKTSGILPRDGAEERFCYALGEMVRQFTKTLYAKGIYREAD